MVDFGRARGLGLAREGVWGIEATAIQGRTMVDDSRVLYVQPSHPQATDAGNTGEDELTPFATITAALARCRPYKNDTVVVGGNEGWVYGGGSTWVTGINEAVTIPATLPGVRLIGVSPSPLGVYWDAQGLGNFALTVYALDVEIAGFAFQGTGNGIYVEWDGATMYGENTHIHHCFFDEAIDTAIQLEYVWFALIHNCYFQQCDAYGIYVDPAGSGIAYARILSNYFMDCDVAMALRACDDSEIAYNTIYNGNAQGGALATDEGIDTTGGRQNSVHHNAFSCLLPVPANGDWNDLNTAAATDAWVQNYCLDGPNVANP